MDPTEDLQPSMYCRSTDAGLEEQSQLSEGTNETNKTEIKKTASSMSSTVFLSVI